MSAITYDGLYERRFDEERIKGVSPEVERRSKVIRGEAFVKKEGGDSCF